MPEPLEESGPLHLPVQVGSKPEKIGTKVSFGLWKKSVGWLGCIVAAAISAVITSLPITSVDIANLKKVFITEN